VYNQKIKQEQMNENSIVRENLITEVNYTPYCGSDSCTYRMPRAKWNSKLNQFSCSCGWVSEFPDDFIKRYKEKWSK
jgi:hypothetical protein